MRKKQEDEKEVMNSKVSQSLTIQSLVNVVMFGNDLRNFCSTMALSHSVAFGVKAEIDSIGRSFWIVYV